MEGYPEKFSGDAEENLRMENAFLKMKIQAQYGADFHMPPGELPPEIENQFLKNILMFETAHDNSKLITIYELLGKPAYKKADELNDEAISHELKRMYELMNTKNISLDTLVPYDDRLIYSFITEELFLQQTEDNIPGEMNRGYIYEEFHPNHSYDIVQRTMEFLKDWREQTLTIDSWEMADQFIHEDGRVFSKEEGVQLIKNFFNAFTSFTNWQDGFGKPQFQFMPDGLGLGNVDGAVKYDAIMENGEVMHFEGPLKLYLSNTGGWWQIFFFHIPGFNWK
jgi:hypothetical protein